MRIKKSEAKKTDKEIVDKQSERERTDVEKDERPEKPMR